MGYRKRLLRCILAKTQTDMSGEHVIKSITVHDAIYWISNAWCDVTPDTIQKCYARCGFTFFDGFDADNSDPADDCDGVSSILDSVDAELDELDELVQHATAYLKLEPMTSDEFANIDKDVEVHVGEADDLQTALSSLHSASDVNDDDDLEEVTPLPTTDEVLKSLQILKSYCSPCNSAFNAAINMESLVSDMIIRGGKHKTNKQCLQTFL